MTLDSSLILSGTFKIKSDYVVQVTVTQAPGRRVYSSSPPSIDVPKPQTSLSRIYVSWLNGHWKVVEVGGATGD